MRLPVIFMYSGQGSQYYQMGRTLFDENAIFRHAMIHADDIYQHMTGLSVIKHLYGDPLNKGQPFTQTTISHPAIFMIEYALTQVLFAQNIIPDMVLGASLGEFMAAVVAGVINFEFALSAVIQQALILEQCLPGGMLAILAEPNLYYSQTFMRENSELAAINFNSHFVVAGSSHALSIISKKLDERDIVSQLIPVSKAFHSSMIDSARIPFLQAIESLAIHEATMPYVSCVEGGVLGAFKQEHFWNIARQPILFQRSIHQLEKKHAAIYIDLGPSGTLATFVKYNLAPDSQSRHFSILVPFGDDNKGLEKVSTFLKEQK